MTIDVRLDDQARKGHIVSIDFRVAELQALAVEMTGPDAIGMYTSLQDFLDTANTAASAPPSYLRMVDVLWLHPTVHVTPQFATLRGFRGTYNGVQRTQGAFRRKDMRSSIPDGNPYFLTIWGFRCVWISTPDNSTI